MKLKSTVGIVRLTIAAGIAFLGFMGARGDWTWTGGSTESTKYWSDTTNWSGSDGTWFVNADTAPTIYFSELSSIANILRIDCGTAESPVVFTTGDTDNQTKGLSMNEGSGNAIIGKGADAVLKVDGGAYTFANDLVAGSANGKTGTFILDKGKVASRYWTVLCGYENGSTGNIIVNGGEFAVGSGNGRLVIGQFGDSTATFTQTEGTVTSQQGDAALEMACNNANATYNISGGSYTATGKAWIGCGTGTANVNISGSGVMTITDGTYLGHASGAIGTITITGGEFKPNWVVLGGVSGATGNLVVDGGTLTMGAALYVNETQADNTGKLEVKSGTATLHATYVGRAANCTGTIDISGGIVTCDNEFKVGLNSTATSTLNVSGGSLSINSSSLYLGESGTGTANVSGGNLLATEDLLIGCGGNGVINISGTGVVACRGANQEAKWIKLGNSGSGDNAINLNEGGTLQAWHIERLTTEGTATVNFNGGTLVALGVDDAWNKYLIGNVNAAHTVNPLVTVAEKGGTIDVGANNIMITAPVSGTGTLAKSGSGTLTFTGSYFGGISVNADAGSVTTPDGDTVTAGTTVFLASGATGSMAPSDLNGKNLVIESDGCITITGVTLDFTSVTEQKLFDVTSFKLIGSAVSVETDVTDYFTVSGATAAHKVVYKDGAIYAVADLTENKWIATEAGAWSDPKNWSENTVPSDKSLVVFERDAVVTCSGTESTKSWLRLVIRNGATVEFKNTDDTTYPEWIIDTDSIEGTGRIILTHCGLNAMSDVTIPSTINLVIQNTTSTAADGYDCWLAAADGCTLTIAGGVTVKNFMVTNGSVVFGGSVAFDSGARLYIAAGATTFNGAVTCAGTASLEKASAASVAKGEDSTFTQPTVGSSHVDAAIASLYSVDTSVNYWVGGESGNWNVEKNWNYGVPAESSTARFDSAETIYLEATKTVASIVVNTSVMFSSTDLNTVHPTIYIHDVDGTGTIRLNHVGFEGNGGDYRIGSASDNALTLEFVSTTTDSWLKNVNVYAPITGSGIIIIYEGAKLYGNNSEFTGAVTKDNVDARFMTPQSGFPNATSVTINGTLWLWFTEGEIAFGGNFAAYTQLYANGINMPGDTTAVTLTLGGNNGSVAMTQSANQAFYSAYLDSNGWVQGTDKFTLRKIGTGDMTLGMESVYNLSLEGGSATLNADSSAVVTVKEGATLNVNAARIVATANFQSGSTLQSAFYETTVDEVITYGVQPLTVTGVATLDGVTLTATGTTPDTNTVYTVLSANSVFGSVKSEIADPDDTDLKAWKVCIDSNAVNLAYKSKVDGVIFLVR